MLTIRQVAEITGAAESSLRVWLANEDERQKRFPNAKKETSPIGDYWVIPESDIQGFEKRERGRPARPGSKRSKAARDSKNN